MFSKLSHLVTPPKPKKKQKFFSSVTPPSTFTNFSDEITPPTSKNYDKGLAKKVMMVQDVERPPTIDEVQFMVKEKEKVLKEHIECAACKVINRLAKERKELAGQIQVNV